MSKFAKPKAVEIMSAAPLQEGAPDAKPVRFTMPLEGDLAAQVDAACKAAGGVSRLAWIRGAILDKLKREGQG